MQSGQSGNVLKINKLLRSSSQEPHDVNISLRINFGRFLFLHTSIPREKLITTNKTYGFLHF